MVKKKKRRVSTRYSVPTAPRELPMSPLSPPSFKITAGTPTGWRLCLQVVAMSFPPKPVGLPSMAKKWNVIDLFSGGGGMSCGFHRHPKFRLVGAVDAQNGKPSSGKGSLECNRTYAKNIGIEPLAADIAALTEAELRAYLFATSGTDHVDVVISCAPCRRCSRPTQPAKGRCMSASTARSRMR